MSIMDPINLAYVGFISKGNPSVVPGTNQDHATHDFAMRIFNRDAAHSSEAWRFWEVRPRANALWIPCERNPSWFTTRGYRYVPSAEAILRCKQERLKLNIGETYWAINLLASDFIHEGEWENTEQQNLWLQRGLIFNSRTAAKQTAERLMKNL